MKDLLLNLQAKALGRKLGRREMVLMRIVRREGSQEMSTCTAIARPYIHRTTVSVGGNELFAEGYDGETAWVSEKGAAAQPVTHPVAAAYARREGLWLAGRRSLKEFIQLGYDVQYLSDIHDATGRNLPAFRLALAAQASKLLFVDPKTGVILVERDELVDDHDDYQRLERHTIETQAVQGLRFPIVQHVIDLATAEPVAVLEWLCVEVKKRQAAYLSPLGG